jgi:hypothetical protein
MEKIKVIYIMGAGRSGSTLLGILLGNMEKYFFAGELHLWNMTRGKTFNERNDVIDFWENVADEFSGKEEYFQYDFDKNLEFHTAIPSLLGFHKKELIKKFHEQSEKLFAAVKKQSGKQSIVDSSHYALRAYWLSKNPSLDVSYIYLYRNPADVVNSFRKKNVEHVAKNFFSANAYLVGVSILINFIYWILPREKKIRIRYEDVLKCTQSTLNRIERVSTVPMNEIDTSTLKTGYIFRSNRIRHSEKISLQKENGAQRSNIFLKSIIYILHSPFLIMHRRKCKNTL